MSMSDPAFTPSNSLKRSRQFNESMQRQTKRIQDAEETLARERMTLELMDAVVKNKFPVVIGPLARSQLGYTSHQTAWRDFVHIVSHWQIEDNPTARYVMWMANQKGEKTVDDSVTDNECRFVMDLKEL